MDLSPLQPLSSQNFRLISDDAPVRIVSIYLNLITFLLEKLLFPLKIENEAVEYLWEDNDFQISRDPKPAIEKLSAIYEQRFSHSSELFANYCHRNNVIVYTIQQKQSQKLAGYAVYRRTRSIKSWLKSTNIWLYSIAIDKDFAGRQLGRRILEASTADVLGNYAPQNLYLIVENENRAKMLYLDTGWNELFSYNLFRADSSQAILRKSET